MSPTIYGVLMFFMGLFVSGQGIVYFAIIATLFGATAAAYVMGGANIVPAMVAQGFVGISLLRKEGLKGFLRPITFGSPPFWLLMLTIWAVLSAFALPRFFEGQFLVASFDRSSGSDGGFSPIKPVSLNITQSLYAFMALMTFLMMRTLLARPGAYRAVIKAMLWLAGLNAIAAIVGLVEHHLGLPPILAYIKNANYAMMGGEVAGLVRITGTFSETSAFSQFTLAIIAFTHILWINDVHKGWARALTLINLVLLLMSTSGTAYIGFSVCMSMALAFAFWRLFRQRSMGPYSLYLKLAVLGLLISVAVMLFVPPALKAVSDFFSVVIGQKLTSESGYTRMALNIKAWETFVDSFGLGAGLGCCRASSFAMVVLSNLGWVGVVLFLLFVGPLLGGKVPAWANKEEWVVALAARCALVALLISALIVSLVYDLGFLFYICAALAYLPSRRPEFVPAAGSERDVNRPVVA